MTSYKVGHFVGSLSSTSINRLLAKAWCGWRLRNCSGDAAVMLEAIEPGLYTMNVGTLLPQETAKVTFSHAILFRWAGDRLRSSCRQR